MNGLITTRLICGNPRSLYITKTALEQMRMTSLMGRMFAGRSQTSAGEAAIFHWEAGLHTRRRVRWQRHGELPQLQTPLPGSLENECSLPGPWLGFERRALGPAENRPRWGRGRSMRSQPLSQATDFLSFWGQTFLEATSYQVLLNGCQQLPAVTLGVQMSRGKTITG